MMELLPEVSKQQTEAAYTMETGLLQSQQTLLTVLASGSSYDFSGFTRWEEGGELKAFVDGLRFYEFVKEFA